MTDRKAIERAARGGDEEAIFELAFGLHVGRWDEPATEEAARWYRRLAEKGHAESQYQLAWLLKHELAPSQARESWSDWYRRAAEQGHVCAAYNLGHVLLRGDNVAQDVAAGVRWLERAWEAGDADAAYYLAIQYGAGELVPEDLASSFRYALAAAEADHHRAQLTTAMMFLEGYGTDRDLDSAHVWLTKTLERPFEDEDMASQTKSVLRELHTAYREAGLDVAPIERLLFRAHGGRVIPLTDYATAKHHHRRDLEKNHRRFVEEAVTAGEVWTIASEDAIATWLAHDRRRSIMPFWSDRESAARALAAAGELLAGHNVACLDLEDFDDLLADLPEQMLVGTNYTEDMAGLELEPAALRESIARRP
jgi:hypothetical protein